MTADVLQLSETSFQMNPPPRRGGRMKRTYRCRHCARIFKRSEHCARHERVHTQEKPFPCAYCDRRYARKDLVKRHERTLHAEEYRKAHPEEFGGDSSRGSEDSVLDGSSPQSKTTSQRLVPPLTPPTEFPSVELNEFPELGQVVNVESAIPYLGQSSVGFSPPSSSSGEESRIPQSDLGGNLARRDSFQIDLGFSPTQMMAPQTPYAFDLSGQIELSSPNKRRRIEMEPLLMEYSTPQIDPVHERHAVQNSEFSPDNIDPSLEELWPATARAPLEREPSFAPFDFSAEFGAVFDIDNLSCIQESFDGQSMSRPRVQKEKCPKLPDFQFDKEIHSKLCEDARSRMPFGEISETLIPTLNDLERFFSGYLECFHRHFPILHLPSLDLRETPSPLIFAICSIGAQYRLARQKAKNLFALAGTMSSFALRGGLPINDGRPKPAALWIMQTRVLLSLCGMFSGKTNVVLRTVENLGLFAIDYRLRKSLLSQASNSSLEWEEWISRESSKRLLCGMFIVSNLISSTFGITPGFSHTDDLDFEVLEEERLWNASSAQEWQSLKSSSLNIRRPTVRDAMTRMMSDEETGYDNSACEISGLTMLLITHATNIYMGSIRELAELSPKQLQSSILESALSTLRRCQDIVTSTRGREDETTLWTEAEGPLMFNCQGVILMAYVRLSLDMSALNRLSLLNDNPDDILSAAVAFAEAHLQRSPSMTKAVSKSYERLLATVRIGHMFLRKTAAFSWSLEHAVAGWVSTLLITKWIHTIETASFIDPPNVEEAKILDGFNQLLSEGSSEYNGASIAAAVAHFCSTTLNDVWVWGITPRMAHVLQQLVLAYEERHQGLRLAHLE